MKELIIKKERKRIESILVLFLFISLIFLILNNNSKNSFEEELTNNQNLGIKASQISNSIFDWNTTWGGIDLDSGFSLSIDYDNNLYISGYTRSFGPGFEALFLVKFNNSGILQWNVTWGGIERDTMGKIAVDSKGYIYLVGYKVYGTGDIDMCLIKYNSSGQKEWEKIWGNSGSSHLIPEDIAVDSADNIYITGYNITGNSVDLIIIKLNSSGYEQWMQTWDEGTNTVGRGVAFDTSDNIYITGQKTKADYDIILLKYNNSGSFKWNRTWGGNNQDIGWAVSTDSVDNVYVMGQTDSFGEGDEDFVLLKYNSTGDLMWNRSWGGIDRDRAMGMTCDSNDNILVIGWTRSFGKINNDIFLVKYNSLGSKLWNFTWDGGDNDSGRGIVLDSSENIYLMGNTNSFGAGGTDVILLKAHDPKPNMNFISFQVDDDNSGNSQGDNDGLIDTGEIIELRILLQNEGEIGALNVNATISSSDNYITIINGYQDFINIPQYATESSTSYYIFKINSSCPSDYYIPMNLEINASNGGVWYSSFQIHVVGSGDPVYHSFSVFSESDGDLLADNDDIIDAGETIMFNLTLKNLGGANLYGVSGILEENDPYIIINNNSADFGTINSSGGENSGQFGINVSGVCPDKHNIDFDINLTDNEGTGWELSFSLIVNGTPDYKTYSFNIIEYEGDGDNFVDAGESWYADISIMNNGSAIGKEIYVLLNSSDPYISFFNSSRNLNFGNININKTTSYENISFLDDYWRFIISDTTPVDYQIRFTIIITDDIGISKIFQVNITVIEGFSIFDENGNISPTSIDFVIISMIIVLGIVGSLGIVIGNHKYSWLNNLKRKRGIKHKERIVEPSKTILNPVIRKILYFIPILVFYCAWWVDIGISISYLTPYLENQDLTIFGWVFGWTYLTDDFLVYTNTFSSFFFGCYSWSIIAYYLGTKNPARCKRAVKSIYLCFPLWFIMSTYLGIIGVNSYYNIWLSLHIIFGIWVALGPIISTSLVLAYIIKIFDKTKTKTKFDLIIERESKYDIPRPRLKKILDFFERFQPLFFILIFLPIGTFLSINIILISKRFTYLVLLNIFWTFLTLLSIFLINFLFSMRFNYHAWIKQEEEELLLDEFQVLLRRSKELAERGNKNYSKKLYQPAIENWEKSIDYYEEALKKTTEKKKIKGNLIILKESMFNAYKGRANVHNKKALKAYEKPDLQIAKREWLLANSNFQAAIDLNKGEKLNFSSNDLQKAIKNTEIRLNQLEIEMVILDADYELKKAHSLQKKDVRKAIKMVNDIILKYSEAKEKANKNTLFKPLSETLETKIINCRKFQLKLQEKMDEMIGITPISKKIKVDEINIIDSEIPSLRKEDGKKPNLSIIREFEFIGGQIRFKVGLKNNTQYSLTSLKITFDIPKALKWILHEPGYERKGDSLLISKLGVNEKKAISLYLEPINCMESPINATVSFFDVRDKPHAFTMKPKIVAITCPIFFTEVDANLARVKSLRRRLTHHDKKIFPLIKSDESLSIFASIVSVLEKFDIKLTFKDFSEEDRFGEAWFYGITKVKKNQIVIYVLLDGENKKVEIEVSGNDEPQITAFLAEIGDRTRKQLIHNKIIDIEDDFYDMRVSILSKLCPYCYTSISGDQVQKFNDGKLIQCKNCNVELKVNEK